MPVKKSGLGLLNPITSVNDKCLSFQRARADLMGEGAFSNANRLLALREESHDEQKNQDDDNDAKLKGLVRDLYSTYFCLILCTENTGGWFNVQGTTVTGTVLVDRKFCDFYAHIMMLNPPPPNLQRKFDVYGSSFDVRNALSRIKGGLIIAHQN